MHKHDTKKLVPRIIVFLLVVTNILRVYSIISPVQTIYAVIILILLALILSKVIKALIRRKNKV